jgi:hypothetical protein
MFIIYIQILFCFLNFLSKTLTSVQSINYFSCLILSDYASFFQYFIVFATFGQLAVRLQGINYKNHYQLLSSKRPPYGVQRDAASDVTLLQK